MPGRHWPSGWPSTGPTTSWPSTPTRATTTSGWTGSARWSSSASTSDNPPRITPGGGRAPPEPLGTVGRMTSMPVPVGGPYFEDFKHGQVFNDAPAVTLSDGLATLHQSLSGDRLRLPLD